MFRCRPTTRMYTLCLENIISRQKKILPRPSRILNAAMSSIGPQKNGRRASPLRRRRLTNWEKARGRGRVRHQAGPRPHGLAFIVLARAYMREKNYKAAREHLEFLVGKRPFRTGFLETARGVLRQCRRAAAPCRRGQGENNRDGQNQCRLPVSGLHSMHSPKKTPNRLLTSIRNSRSLPRPKRHCTPRSLR